jgi:hypothetical protein
MIARVNGAPTRECGHTALLLRLRLPVAPSAGLKALAGEYFDPAGLLRPEHFRHFGDVLDKFRKADGQAVIYSDVLEYIDRENEIAEGLEYERNLLAKLRGGAGGSRECWWWLRLPSSTN